MCAHSHTEPDQIQHTRRDHLGIFNLIIPAFKTVTFLSKIHSYSLNRLTTISGFTLTGKVNCWPIQTLLKVSTFEGTQTRRVHIYHASCVILYPQSCQSINCLLSVSPLFCEDKHINLAVPLSGLIVALKSLVLQNSHHSSDPKLSSQL